MLRTFLRRLAWALIVLALVLGPILAVLASEKFQYCYAHQGNYPSAQGEADKSSAVLVSEPSAGALVYRCLGGFANDNGVAITALATILLTVVTGGLVFVGFRQHTTIRAQLRAYVFVENCAIVDGPTPPNIPVPAPTGCPNSRVLINNFGQTPAFNVRHTSQLIIAPHNVHGTLPTDASIRSMPGGTSIGPSGMTTMDRNLFRQLTAFEIQALGTAGMALIVFGKIIYDDAFAGEATEIIKLKTPACRTLRRKPCLGVTGICARIPNEAGEVKNEKVRPNRRTALHHQ